MFKCKFCNQKFSFMTDRDLHQSTCQPPVTQQQFEAKIKEIKRGQGTLDLNTLSNEDVFALLAWEYWKDGADWDDLVVDMITGQYLPFNTRETAIKALQDIFGY